MGRVGAGVAGCDGVAVGFLTEQAKAGQALD